MSVPRFIDSLIIAIEKNFLFNFDKKNYIEKQKALILFWVLVCGLFLFSTAFFIQLIFQHSESMIFIYVDLFIIASIIISITLLFLGRYRCSVTFLLLMVLTAWSFGSIYKFEQYINTGLNSFLYLIFAIIVMEALLGNKRILSVVTLYFISINLYFLIKSRSLSNYMIRDEIFKNTLDISISILLLYVLTFIYSIVTEKAIQKAQIEIDHNSELNITLEDKVLQRTEEIEAAYVELEAMNHNLVQVNRDLEKAQRMMSHDLRMAQNVQSRFFMSEVPQTDGWDIAFKFKPLTGVSGDIYDFYISNNKLGGISLCDVSGHGVSSGLLTLLAKSVIFRYFTDHFKEDLNKIIDMANKELISEIDKLRNYLTGVFLKITDDGNIQYVNAAHPDIIKYESQTGKCYPVGFEDAAHKGFFLGMSGSENSGYGLMNFPMKEGDCVLVFSDCLIETRDSKGILYGYERVMNSLKNCSKEMSSEEYLETVLHDFYYETGGNLNDDLTVILLKKV